MPVLHMETDSVRSTGQALGSAAALLADQMFDLQVSINSLANGWQGPASEMFIAEITPWLRQLTQLTDEVSTLRDRVFREADEWERVDSMMGGAAATLGALFAQQVHQAAMQTAIGVMARDLAEIAHTTAIFHDMSPISPDSWRSDWQWHFDPIDMIDCIPQGARPDGAPSTELSNAMAQLSDLVSHGIDDIDPVTEQKLLETIANQRGLTYEQVVGDYRKFLGLIKDNPPAPTDRAEYWGTIQQLRFGTVVGDSLGIDAVFGSLLSPTGGLVGPSEGRVIHDVLYRPDSALAYHGIYHDAAGFFAREPYNLTPSYEYVLTIEEDRRFEGPFAPILDMDKFKALDGQETGIAFWHELLKINGKNPAGSSSDLPKSRGAGGGGGGGGGGAW
ncbi:MAG: hypothetical protein KA314_22660 [Chloroflexi bacterium]|nr:hypothetical protein [Chloroflexota bacterium]MBP8058646.1 hypothetical protein [Chloroflexota bacterium]